MNCRIVAEFSFESSLQAVLDVWSTVAVFVCVIVRIQTLGYFRLGKKMYSSISIKELLAAILHEKLHMFASFVSVFLFKYMKKLAVLYSTRNPLRYYTNSDAYALIGKLH